MLARTQACDHERLRSLLDGDLPEPVEAEAASHVELCETCRQQLETLAAEDCWWRETRELLSVGWVSDPTAFAHDRVERVGSETQPTFLAPSDNPAMLGRLGEFDVLEIIGRGGMGIVLKGYDHELNRWVAIKVLGPQYAENGAARKRFAREAQAAAAVVHPHVIGIHAVDAAHQPPYFVMPFVPGESLQQRLDRVGPLELPDVLRIGQQIADGLAAAHAQGLVHRDIKPANILLERNVDRVVITDFGLARAVDDASLTQSGIIAGTPQYMSPEQARGEALDHRADLFSLGSVLYALLAGHPPFRADSPYAMLRRVTDDTPRSLREINSSVPDWLEAFVFKLLAKDREARWQSAREVADSLTSCLAHIQQPTAASLPSEVKSLVNRRSNHKVRWLIAASAFLVLFASWRRGGG
ncbi:MAG: serine/threonine protein kinase, partial [Planctomycetaceae bacterium]|nr:serine/threonine protein kinase [Planctomycetaceae bacterium]